MKNDTDLEIFLVSTPGLEPILRKEAIEKGFKKPRIAHGGVTVEGGWSLAWRANLELRGASRVLVRIGSFKATHLSQLDKRARQFNWLDTLNKDVPVRVEASCKKSSIYHQKAAAERIERALSEEHGIPISPDAEVCIKLRIMEDICTISIDTSGEGLHKRGHKEALNKAPMRETLAALLLRDCGFDGNEAIVDPMCGSGTFVLEAAEIATGLYPGRSRSFAFEQLANFDEAAWLKLKQRNHKKETDMRFYGFDRDEGAITKSQANAERADLLELCIFKQQTISDLKAPDGPGGLVIVNPPYGIRIGETKKLRSLYQTLGQKLKSDFIGWRVGLVTNSDALAQATGLPFEKENTPFSHGGIRVKLYKTDRL